MLCGTEEAFDATLVVNLNKVSCGGNEAACRGWRIGGCDMTTVVCLA